MRTDLQATISKSSSGLLSPLPFQTVERDLWKLLLTEDQLLLPNGGRTAANVCWYLGLGPFILREARLRRRATLLALHKVPRAWSYHQRPIIRASLSPVQEQSSADRAEEVLLRFGIDWSAVHSLPNPSLIARADNKPLQSGSSRELQVRGIFNKPTNSST